MGGRLDVWGLSDVGKRRESNEDQFLIADLNKSMYVHQTSLGLDHQTRLFGNSQGHLLLVADGMGGHASGERASTIAVDAVATYVLNTMRWFFQLDDSCEDDFLDGLKSALQHCQEMLSIEADAIPKRKGMGTTLTMGYLIWPRLYVVHAGDSRCYLCRDGRLEQITRDHTVAQQFVESGDLEPDEAEQSKWSHVLWNVIGGDTDELTPEVYRTDLKVGDAILLCSDGLIRHVDDCEITRILKCDDSAKASAEQLVSAANDGGGSDNITVVVGRFLELDEEPREETAEVKRPHDQKVDPSADTDPHITVF